MIKIDEEAAVKSEGKAGEKQKKSFTPSRKEPRLA